MQQVWGDAVSVISAVIYGLYATLLKKCVNNEEQSHWFVFFLALLVLVLTFL